MSSARSSKKYYKTLKNRNDFIRLQTAFYGLANAFQREIGVRNFTITGTILSLIFWIWLRDYNIVEQTLFFTFLITAFELMNSSIETLSDYVQPEKSMAIKHTKDAAAGAVLMIIVIAIVQTVVDIVTLKGWHF